MNDLERFFRRDDHRQTAKHPHYFDIYETYLARFRDKEVCLLEIGIAYGGSLQMWKNYLGEKAKIYGFDANNILVEPQIECFIGRQDDINSLRELKTKIPKLDVIIDDCSHISSFQKITFNELFWHLNDGGIYLCEDVFTSYLTGYMDYEGYTGGSFVDYMKDLVDVMNQAECVRDPYKQFIGFVKNIHFYAGITIIQKGPTNSSSCIYGGTQRD